MSNFSQNKDDAAINDTALPEILVSPEAEEVDRLVDEIGRLKSYLILLNLPNDKLPLNEASRSQIGHEVSQIEAAIQQKRILLSEMGAVPEKNLLEKLPIVDDARNGTQSRGVLINDFAAFEKMYGSAYYLWGTWQTVNTANGSFDTYTIRVEEYDTATSLNGRLHASWDSQNLYTANLQHNMTLANYINAAIDIALVGIQLAGYTINPAVGLGISTLVSGLTSSVASTLASAADNHHKIDLSLITCE